MQERGAAVQERGGVHDHRMASSENGGASYENRSASREDGAASYENGCAASENGTVSCERSRASCKNGSASRRTHAYRRKESRSRPKTSRVETNVDASGNHAPRREKSRRQSAYAGHGPAKAGHYVRLLRPLSSLVPQHEKSGRHHHSEIEPVWPKGAPADPSCERQVRGGEKSQPYEIPRTDPYRALVADRADHFVDLPRRHRAVWHARGRRFRGDLNVWTWSANGGCGCGCGAGAQQRPVRVVDGPHSNHRVGLRNRIVRPPVRMPCPHERAVARLQLAIGASGPQSYRRVRSGNRIDGVRSHASKKKGRRFPAGLNHQLTNSRIRQLQAGGMLIK